MTGCGSARIDQIVNEIAKAWRALKIFRAAALDYGV